MSIPADTRPLTEDDFTFTSEFTKFLRYIKGEAISDTIMLPDKLVTDIEHEIMQRSVIRSLASVAKTSRDSFSVVLDSKDVSKSGWIENHVANSENDTILQSKTIKLHEIFVKTIVPQSTIEDASVSVETFIKEKLIMETASVENRAFLYGNGNNEPDGILCSQFSEDEAENSIQKISGKFDVDTLYSVLELLDSSYAHNAHWLMSREVANIIRKIRDQKNGNYIWQNSIARGIPDTLLGIPVAICDDMPKSTTNDKPVILLGDFKSCYQIVEHHGIKLLKDILSKKPLVEFFATKRVGGTMTNFNAVKALFYEKNME